MEMRTADRGQGDAPDAQHILPFGPDSARSVPSTTNSSAPSSVKGLPLGTNPTDRRIARSSLNAMSRYGHERRDTYIQMKNNP